MRLSIINRLAALLLLFIAGAAGASAQGIPCISPPPDCPGNSFVAQVPVMLTLPGGCTVAVQYSSRCACGMWNDFVITQVNVQSNPSCNILTSQQVVDLAAIELVRFMINNGLQPCANPIPRCPQMATNWRALRGSCVYEEWIDGTRVIRTCEGSACCWRTYDVCRNSDGTISVTVSGTFNATPCNGHGPAGQACVTACPQ